MVKNQCKFLKTYLLYQHSFLQLLSDISFFSYQLFLFSGEHLFYRQNVLSWIKSLLKSILGCSRYQLLNLPAIFTLANKVLVCCGYRQLYIVFWMCSFYSEGISGEDYYLFSPWYIQSSKITIQLYTNSACVCMCW